MITGAGIRRMRLLRSMKQEHLAELLGVNQATVSRWERDQLALSSEQAVKLNGFSLRLDMRQSMRR